MAHISEFERDQLLLLPEVVDDYVGSDNPVRFIDAFVDGLDLVEAGFAQVQPKATGRPGYAPGDLLKLYIYGYLNRVRSSRRLEADLALRTMQGAPAADASFQCAAEAAPEFGMTSDHLVKDRDRPQARRGDEHGHDILLEDGAERIGTAPFAPLLLLGRQSRILSDAIGRGGAERRLGRRDGNGWFDGTSCKASTDDRLNGGRAQRASSKGENHFDTRSTAITGTLQSGTPACAPCLRSGYALPASRNTGDYSY
jgi:hypothetical protein